MQKEVQAMTDMEKVCANLKLGPKEGFCCNFDNIIIRMKAGAFFCRPKHRKARTPWVCGWKVLCGHSLQSHAYL